VLDPRCEEWTGIQVGAKGTLSRVQQAAKFRIYAPKIFKNRQEPGKADDFPLKLPNIFRGTSQKGADGRVRGVNAHGSPPKTLPWAL
jgi:hypothetical protein